MVSANFEATIKSSDMYSLEQTTVRPYCREKLKVMKGGATHLPLRPRLPPDAVEKLEQLWTAIVRPRAKLRSLWRQVRSAASPLIAALYFVAIVSFESTFLENLQLRA